MFNQGRMQRDFTYIDDIVEGVIRCLDKPATPNPAFDPLDPDPATAAAPHWIFNIGNSRPTPLLRFIEVLEQGLSWPAHWGDVAGLPAVEPLTSLRGMVDLLPDRTPLLEVAELFARGIGEATDVVSKAMYTFLDRSEPSCTLRPDGTDSVVHAAIQHGQLGRSGPRRAASASSIRSAWSCSASPIPARTWRRSPLPGTCWPPSHGPKATERRLAAAAVPAFIAPGEGGSVGSSQGRQG